MMTFAIAYAIPREHWPQHGRAGRFPITQPSRPTEAEARRAYAEHGPALPTDASITIAGPFVSLASAMLAEGPR